MLKRLAIRPEDILAVLMIIPSLWVARQSEYYSFLNGNIVVSKLTGGLLLLLILSILTALYENRAQRIIDTIKSGVKIPQVTMSDQLIYLWKTKFRILLVARDYLPFLICILAYHTILSDLPHVKYYHLDNFFMVIEKSFVESWRVAVIGWFSHNVNFKAMMSVAYKTYILSVPILAAYLYMVKDLKKFRYFLLAVVFGSAMALIFNMLLPSMGLDAYTKQIVSAQNGSVSLPTVYSSVVMFFSFKIGRTLGLVFIPLALLSFLADILTYSNYLVAVLIGILIGVIAVPLARYVGEKF